MLIFTLESAVNLRGVGRGFITAILCDDLSRGGPYKHNEFILKEFDNIRVFVFFVKAEFFEKGI